MKEQKGRTILITGCSSGIGLATARVLAERGWRVFATCRKETDCEGLRSQGLESFPLDYEDPASIAAGFDETMERCNGHLDALFNNGAYAIPGMVEDITPDALRTTFEANFFGWHDLVCRVLPGMRARGSGRIIQNSSVLGFVALKLRGSYVATKYAIEGLTDTLRLELRGTGIHVVLIEPGPIATRFGENAMKQFHKWVDLEHTEHKAIYEQQLLRPSGKPSFSTLPAEAVANKVVLAVERPVPKPRYYVTTATYIKGALRRALPTRSLDAVLDWGS